MPESPDPAIPAPAPASASPSADSLARRPRWILFALVVAAGALLDLATKSWAHDFLNDSEHPEAGQFWPGVFVLEWTHNDGALFGLMGGRNLVFLLLSVAAVPLILYFYRTLPRAGRISTLALGGILAGTIGNLYDRIAFGSVRDFIYVQAIHYPVFNLADAWICIGAGLFAFEILRGRGHQPGVKSGEVAS